MLLEEKKLKKTNNCLRKKVFSHNNKNLHQIILRKFYKKSS